MFSFLQRKICWRYDICPAFRGSFSNLYVNQSSLSQSHVKNYVNGFCILPQSNLYIVRSRDSHTVDFMFMCQVSEFSKKIVCKFEWIVYVRWACVWNMKVCQPKKCEIGDFCPTFIFIPVCLTVDVKNSTTKIFVNELTVQFAKMCQNAVQKWTDM